jgi:hypothetical protein
MKCIDFEDRLNELLDDRLPAQDDPQLLAHAQQCADCREMLAAELSLFRGLRILERRHSAPELGSRVLAQVARPEVVIPPIPPPRFHLPWMMILSSAALLLVAVSVGVWIANSDNGNSQLARPGAGGRQGSGDGLALIKPGGDGQAAKPHDHWQPKAAPAPATAAGPLVAQDSPSLPRTTQAADPYRLALESLSAHFPQAAWPQVEAIDVEQYAPGIRPIRESFEVAIDGLLRTLPGMKDSRPTQPQARQYGIDGLYLS